MLKDTLPLLPLYQLMALKSLYGLFRGDGHEDTKQALKLMVVPLYFLSKLLSSVHEKSKVQT